MLAGSSQAVECRAVTDQVYPVCGRRNLQRQVPFLHDFFCFARRENNLTKLRRFLHSHDADMAG